MSIISDVFGIDKDSYIHLEFDVSDSCNISDYYSMFKIPDDEKLLVYIDRGRGVGKKPDMDATIITDRAIYTHPRHGVVSGINFILLSNIKDYVIFQDSRFVKLFGRDSQIDIYGKGMPSRECVGEELVNFLRVIQRNLIIRDREAKVSFNNVLAYALSAAKKELSRHGLLDDHYLALIDAVGLESDFAGECAILKAEHYYRLCDQAGYMDFVKNQKDVLSREVMATLYRADEVFFEKFINDLINVDSFEMSELLIKSYLNLKSKYRISLNEGVILCLICARMDDDELLGEILEIIEDRLDENSVWALHDFFARLKYSKMRAVYAKLLANEELFPNELVQTDDLGLGVLHYALMTRDKEIVKRVMSLAKWKNYKCPFPNDKIVSTVYDFNLITAILFEDEALIEEMFALTEPKAHALIRSIRQMEVFIDINESMIEKDPSGQREYKYKKKQYATMKREMETELAVMAHLHAVNLFEKAAIIRDIGHPLASYVLKLVDTPEGLFKRATDTMFGHKLLKYRQMYFVTGQETESGLPSYNRVRGQASDIRYNPDAEAFFFDNPFMTKQINEKRREEQERRRYREEYYKRQESRRRKEAEAEEKNRKEGGWFSRDAHKDISVLKKEYRILVKQYHPDASGNRNSAQTLHQIMLERAKILEHMEAV